MPMTLGLGMMTRLQLEVYSAAPAPPGANVLLQEDGFDILLEDGSNFLLEV